MRNIITILVASLLVLSAVPAVLAVSASSSVGIDVTTEDFPPLVFMCDNRIVVDDAVEPGRFSDDGEIMLERINNYAFEGEQIAWKVLVFDKNGIEKVSDVFATIGSSQGEGNDIEANCKLDHIVQPREYLDETCNARILEEELKDAPENTAAYYTCTLTVETTESMYGEYWVTVEAVDLDGLSGTMDENEFWFFNPVVALNIDGDLAFDNVRPGIETYSDTLLVGNDADAGSGVMLDMFIGGTDFYDSSSSGAKCPTSNQLELIGLGPDKGTTSNSDVTDDTGIRYFATNGAYSTTNDFTVGGRGPGSLDNRKRDSEGYVNIGYADGFNDPNRFYAFPPAWFKADGLGGYEIIQQQPQGPYWVANLLAPGAEMALTFKLDLPEPCNGDFDTGSISFWGEAI